MLNTDCESNEKLDFSSESYIKNICDENPGENWKRNITSFHTAASSGDKSLLKKIIDFGQAGNLETKDLLGRTPLIYSVIYNQVDSASILLKAGARVDNSDNSGQTAFHWAAHKGLHRCVKLLLSSGSLWYQKDVDGVTPLHLSAIHKSAKCLFLILKELKPGEIDIQDSSKKTALHWSAAYCNIEHIRLLLNQDANICIPDMEGKTPLHWVASSSDGRALECVKLLLEKEPGAINWQDYEGRSALHLAVASGTTETVEFLTSKENCNINILDNMFCTPLHWAAKIGLSDKVSLLLDRRAAYASADGNGATPLHYASHHNQAETVKVFLSRSYITDEPDVEGRSALIWASAKKANDVIRVMADHGICLTSGDKNGATALHAAAIQGHICTIELLLDLQLPIDVTDKVGMTPFLRACEMGRAKAAKLLVDSGASLLVKDVNDQTCIHWAAQGGHAYICQILLHHGCAKDVQDSFGMTALHYASIKGYINCVSVLLECKANPDIPDSEGKTPLHWSVMKDHLDVVKLLCEYEANVNSMALIDGWITPLDCALIGDHLDIAQFLQEHKGLSSYEIEMIAATKIQAYFRGHRVRKHSILLNNSKINFMPKMQTKNKSVKERSYSAKNNFIDTLVLDSKEAFLKCTNLHSVMKTDRYKQSDTVSSQFAFNVNNSMNMNLSHKSVKRTVKSRIPVAKGRLLKGNKTVEKQSTKEKSPYVCIKCQKKTIDFIDSQETNSLQEEKAALIVQKAWRKFAMKRRFHRMRTKIKAAFCREVDRRVAEKEWENQLAQFLEEYEA